MEAILNWEYGMDTLTAALFFVGILILIATRPGGPKDA